MHKFIYVLLIFPFLAFPQKMAHIKFEIKNAKSNSINIINQDYTNAKVLFGERNIELSLIDGKADWSTQITEPIFVNSYYQDSITKDYFIYRFYLSPNDNLYFSFDANSPKTTVMVKGKGNKNNQPLIQNLINDRLSLENHKKDSLPSDVFRAIKAKNISNKKIIKDYISKYKPSKDFRKKLSLYTNYYPLWTYINFKGEQKYYIPEAYYRNESKWQFIEDSLTSINTLNNKEVLVIPEHAYFLPRYVSRIKEKLWKHQELLKNYYNTNTKEDALELFKEDPENLLREKIINKYFTGKTSEFLYATLFADALNEKEDNLPEIFSRFINKYPQSEYIPHIELGINKISERRKRTLTDKMLIVENSNSYKTFDDILKLTKGKTVLLDMWGTWCGPCRSELSLNSEYIKNYFKEKNLEYLYVSNYDLSNKKKWKELIAYYNLEGTHILATKALTKSIMETVKGKGYPTYVILKKDGTFELSKAGYPMKREVLISQLDTALKN